MGYDLPTDQELDRLQWTTLLYDLYESEGVVPVSRQEGLSGESVRLHVRTPHGERRIDGSDILAATGRIPNTAGIGLPPRVSRFAYHTPQRSALTRLFLLCT
jgi:hypothetical protein